MGCVSSKLFRKDLNQEILLEKAENFPNHVVSLTSSTYGVLKLDKENQQQQQQQEHHHLQQQLQQAIKNCEVDVKKSSPPRQEPEVINAWELMQGLEEEPPVLVPDKKSPKTRVFLRGFGDIDARSPLKFLNQMASPRKLKKFGGKENSTPKTVLKACNFQGSSRKASPMLRIPRKESPNDAKCESLRIDSGVVLSRRRSLGPLFDPELVASFEKELSEEKEQIKKIVSGTPTTVKNRNSQDSASILDKFEKKCPPGGENAVVLYTTTLRGIRKTFEDCNTARSVIESHQVQLFERDISMHSGFKDELRGIMGTKEVKVPLVFVKGRLIGGADEMVKLEEDGKLGTLFSGIPKAVAVCSGCAGVRFVMCMDCNGSCKVLDGNGKKTVRCKECNENGLIQCPFCS